MVSGVQWAPETAAERRLSLDVAGGSHVGRVRQLNEDSWLARPPVFLVADGMGGHGGGDAASARVVESFEAMGAGPATIADITETIDRCFESVDSLSRGRYAPGTTLVLLAYVTEESRDQWLLANIGDSRAYGLADGKLRLLSHDHSVVQEMIDAGEISESEARVHPERHIITRSIGAMELSAPDFALFEVVPGTRFMLCSDGVTSELDDAEIGRILNESRTASLAVEQLIESAVEAGGHDNVTALVIDVRGPGQSPDEDTLGSSIETSDIPNVTEDAGRHGA